MVTPRVRAIAAVLAVVFLLTTVWAIYYLDSQIQPSSTPGPTTIATYSETGLNTFAAAVSPSVLYNNSTEVYGGNLTLFTPITNWINVSMVYALVSNRTAALALNETFSVKLSTAVWSKTLYTATNATSAVSSAFVSLQTQYDVNVSAIVTLATDINTQIGFVGSEFSLTLDPQISGTVGVGAIHQAVTSEPLLNFTFEASLIRPSGLNFSGSGALLLPAPASSSSPAPVVVPSAALALSLGGLGGSLWFATRRPEEAIEPPLDQMIAPYEEAIAETLTVQGSTTPIGVSRFADLVKIADTLGKPILRPLGPDLEISEFVVLDGDWAYTYRYPGGATSDAAMHVPPIPAAGETVSDPMGASPGPASPGGIFRPGPAQAGGADLGEQGRGFSTASGTRGPRSMQAVGPWAPGAAGHRLAPVPGAAGESPRWTPLSTAAAAVVRRLRQEITRMEGLRLSRETSLEARSRVRRALDLVRSNDVAAAADEVLALSQLLTRESLSEDGASRPTS
jgi:hypothetical protein